MAKKRKDEFEEAVYIIAKSGMTYAEYQAQETLEMIQNTKEYHKKGGDKRGRKKNVCKDNN